MLDVLDMMVPLLRRWTMDATRRHSKREHDSFEYALSEKDGHRQLLLSQE